ncbi:Uncharacterised protein [Mycobacterium tuberculosis]|nr:Uncharacterised protein [Mycobacterium tuberculosis]
MAAGAGRAEEQTGVAAAPAGPADASDAYGVPTVAAGAAGADQQGDPTGAAGPADPSSTGGYPAGPAIATGTEQDPAGPAGPARSRGGGVGRTVPAVTAVAEQPAAGSAVSPGPRSAVGAVADQRTPGERLEGVVHHIDHVLLQGVQGRGAGGGRKAVQAQQHPPGTADAGLAQGRAGPAIATGTEQDPAGPAGPARSRGGGVGRTVPAVTAVAEQPPAGPAGSPGPRGPVGAVADQRTPSQCLEGLIHHIERCLLQGMD